MRVNPHLIIRESKYRVTLMLNHSVFVLEKDEKTVWDNLMSCSNVESLIGKLQENEFKHITPECVCAQIRKFISALFEKHLLVND